MNALSQAEIVRGQEARAALSCARTLKRLSWDYRRWAKEAETAGDLDQYRKYAADARQRWRSAKWWLQFARNRVYG